MGLTVTDHPGYALTVSASWHRCGVTVDFTTRWCKSAPVRSFQVTLQPEELAALGEYLSAQSTPQPADPSAPTP